MTRWAKLNWLSQVCRSAREKGESEGYGAQIWETMAMRKVWIEAALNGPWSRKRQPGIPDTVDAIVAEGIACAAAGASIIHVHAYDGGGPQTFDWQVYARII